MNRSLESALRFINLTASGLLAGSLGFGEAALVPGWQDERPRNAAQPASIDGRYFNAIGPVALASAVALAVAARGNGAVRKVLDGASAFGLAGVLAATALVTVPINRELDAQPASDYPSARSKSLTRNWSLAHSLRTTLGVSAFVCAVASNFARKA